jgi:JAB N-terminal domain
MSLTVEIFRSDDYVPDEALSLRPLLNAVFADIIGPDPGDVVFSLRLYPVADPVPDRGLPVLENLRPSHGYVQVRILRDGGLIYQHPHPVRQLIGQPLRQELRKRDPNVTHWGYGLTGPGMNAAPLTRPAPRVAHETRIRSGPWPRLNLTVEEMPDPEPTETTLAALGVPGGAADPDPAAPLVEVVVAWTETYPFSEEIEEGGFLAGTVYRDAERPGGYLVHVTAFLAAERTGASMLSFTFTGESFLRVGQQLESRGGDEQLLGWYHTHLFAATSWMGLSSVDEELHRSTFKRPWQVAALVNVTSGGRVLRFYHGEGDEMVLVPYWAVPGEDAALTVGRAGGEGTAGGAAEAAAGAGPAVSETEAS